MTDGVSSPVIADQVVFDAFAQVVGQLPNAQEQQMALAFAKLILTGASVVVQTPTEPAPKPPKAWEGPSRVIPGAGPDLSVHRQVAWGEPPKDTVLLCACRQGECGGEPAMVGGRCRMRVEMEQGRHQ